MAAPASFYDQAVANDSSVYTGPIRRSPYYRLYRRAVRLTLDSGTDSVCDLGCGGGHFTWLLLYRKPSLTYYGIDFSAGMIELARKRNPLTHFEVADLRYDEIPIASTYVALEVLEHMDDDLLVLGRLPLRSRLIASVPTFDSESHVRTFPDSKSVLQRFKPLVDIDFYEQIPLQHNPKEAFHLFTGLLR